MNTGLEAPEGGICLGATDSSDWLEGRGKKMIWWRGQLIGVEHTGLSCWDYRRGLEGF